MWFLWGQRRNQRELKLHLFPFSKIASKILKQIEKRKISKIYSKISQLIKTSTLFKLIAISGQSALLYSLFYGMTTSVQDLGLKSTQLNGIFLGLTQSLGFLSVLPITHKMKRREWTLKFQSIILLCTIILFLLSFFFKNSKTALFLETIISTCFLSFITSASFPLLFLYISELFSPENRGLVSALVLFFGKIFGALAPVLSKISQKMGIHILVGCAVPVFFSLPLTFFFLEETLGVGSVKHGFIDYGARELGRDIANYYFEENEDGLK